MNQLPSPKKPTVDMRKRLLIDPAFQLSFMAYSAVAAVAIILVLYGANAYFFWKLIERGREAGLGEDHVFFRFIADQRLLMDSIFMIVGVVVCGLLAVGGLYLSNRVAGPVYRLKKYLMDYRDGSARHPLKFRDNDYFQDLASSVNDCLHDKKPRRDDLAS